MAVRRTLDRIAIRHGACAAAVFLVNRRALTEDANTATLAFSTRAQHQPSRETLLGETGSSVKQPWRVAAELFS